MRTTSDSLIAVLFDQGGLKAVFEHARNAVVATLIVAAGLGTVRTPDLSDLVGVPNPTIAGYIVVGLGCALVLLNFLDGLRKLARLRWHIVLQIALGLGYLFASIRIVQFLIFMRTHVC